MSVLVAVLVTFGVLTKHNEVTAFKASGISLYRLTMPVLFASMALSAGLEKNGTPPTKVEAIHRLRTRLPQPVASVRINRC